MGKFRVVYYDKDDAAAETVVEAENGEAALEQVDDLGVLLSLTYLGPADEAEADEPADEVGKDS